MLSSREIRGNSSIREGSFTGERAFRENHAIHHESGKLVDASIYRQVSHGPTTGTAHAGIYMRILLRAVSRLIKGKVKAIGVETDFREKLRMRHALSTNWEIIAVSLLQSANVTKSPILWSFFLFHHVSNTLPTVSYNSLHRHPLNESKDRQGMLRNSFVQKLYFWRFWCSEETSLHTFNGIVYDTKISYSAANNYGLEYTFGIISSTSARKHCSFLWEIY